MEYRTIADLSTLIRTNIHLVPHDIDLVVGVPRSGMLPALMIALYLNKRVTDIDSFIEGKIYTAGTRSQYIPDNDIKKVLVVDDSVRTGKAINKAKNKIKDADLLYQYIYLAPIATTESKKFVDIYFEIIDDDRLFEWNIFHHEVLESACLDIDGVLNVDPSINTDDDGPNYIHFLQNTKPLFTPTVPIDTLISCRLEKYRSYTEQWLKRHGVRYNHLVMLNLPSKAERLLWNNHGLYKAQYYQEHSNLCLFIESSARQAQVIANHTLKPVICVETNTLVQPDAHMTSRKKIRRAIRHRCPRLYEFVRFLANRN